MEKFGIFELLDALSALTARQTSSNDAQNDRPAAPQPPSENAPSAPKNAALAQEKDAVRAAKFDRGDRQAEALSAFLARHDALSKKALSRDNPHK